MKTLFSITVSLLLAGSLLAQNASESSNPGNGQMSRKEKRNARLESEYRNTSAVLDSMQFVLEAYWLANSWGQRVPVNSNLNFVLVDSTQAVIQTGNNNRMGYNGVGGATAKGKITSYSMSRNEKKKSFTIRMDVSGPAGFYTVFMDIMASGKANATLTGSWPGRLVYSGQIVPLDKSKVYEGSSL